MLTVSCPHCGFARDVTPDRIPDGVVEVTCPKCQGKFPFGRNAVDTPEPIPEEQVPPRTGSLADGLPKAGFWVRVVAAIIDSIALLTIQVILSFLLGVATAAVTPGLDERGLTMVSLAISAFGTCLSIAYYVFFTGYCGQTPGKMAVRVKVIRTDGSDIAYGRAFFREVIGKFVSGILLGIGYLMVAFDNQKQGLHDKIAGTYVIRL